MSRTFVITPKFELVVRTDPRSITVRCTLTFEPDDPQPGWEWPEQLDTFSGEDVTLDGAMRAAWQAFRASRG